MAGQDAIKQKIQLDGEKEYSAAIKAAQRNLRTLRSELKAETAELGKNATEQQKNEAKTKSLKKQIAEQEKIVKAYKAALAEVKEKYGDNEEAVAKWEVKLNDARTALANMKNGLEDAGKGFKAIQDGAASSVLETHALAESFGSISSKADAMAAGMESIFNTVADAITTTISRIWGELSEVASKADEYLDMAAFFGTSATNVQRWSKALEYAGANMGTITNMVSRLKYGGKTDKIAEYFGVSDANYTDDLMYTEVVLKQMFAMKDEMKKNGTWYDAMGEIFGTKKVQEIDGILSDWETIMKGLDENDKENGGLFGLTEEEIEKMAKLNENVMAIKSNWQSLKEMAVVRLFGDLALTISGNVKGIMDALAELMNAKNEEERKTAIEHLKENIRGIVEGAKAAIIEIISAFREIGEEFQGDEDSTISAVGDLFVGLADAMQWFVDNKDSVITALEAIFGVYLATKLGSVALQLADIISKIKVIKLFSTGGAAAGAAGAAGATGAGAAAGASGLGVMAAAGLNGLAAYGIYEGFKGLPADVMTKISEAVGLGVSEGEKKINEIDAQRGVNTMGDKMDDITRMQQASGVNPFQRFWSWITGGGLTPEEQEPEEKTHPGGRVRHITGVAEPIALTGSTPANAQSAAEAYWDLLRSGGTPDELAIAEQELIDHFINLEGGMEQFDSLMDRIEELNLETPDLPSWWFGGEEGNTLTKDDINTFSGLPAQMQKAVQAGVSGIKVNMDGRAVGNLVAPYVSEQIARVAVSE